MKKLTPKQIDFCHAVACDGCTMTDAYIRAYDSKTDNRATVHRNAWAEYQKPHIQEYIQELRQVVRSGAIMGRLELLESTSHHARHAVKHCGSPDYGVRIRVMIQLATLQGYYQNQPPPHRLPNVVLSFEYPPLKKVLPKGGRVGVFSAPDVPLDTNF